MNREQDAIGFNLFLVNSQDPENLIKQLQLVVTSRQILEVHIDFLLWLWLNRKDLSKEKYYSAYLVVKKHYSRRKNSKSSLKCANIISKYFNIDHFQLCAFIQKRRYLIFTLLRSKEAQPPLPGELNSRHLYSVIIL